MTEAVTVALISGLCVAVPSVITTMFSNNKANTLMNYRIDELTKKVEKHNNVVERMALQERETKAIWKRIDEITYMDCWHFIAPLIPIDNAYSRRVYVTVFHVLKEAEERRVKENNG